ncbi:MAG: transporter substrate-binding domain-containing protein, partial [Planctomycetota bacterium]
MKRHNSPYPNLWTYLLPLFLWLTLYPSGPLAAGEPPPILSASEDDYPPFCSVTPRGEADGFSVELLRATLRAMGRRVSFDTGPWSEVKRSLEEGRVQVLPLVGRTPEREALFDFTFPYLTLHGTLVVRKNNTDIRAPRHLRGKRVAVMRGDNAEEFLRRSDLGAKITTTQTFPEALRLVAEGAQDAAVIQRLLALKLIKQERLTNLRTTGPPLKAFEQNFCFAVREGDKNLLALLNEGLSIVIEDETFRRLHHKWFAPLEPAEERIILVGGDHNYPPYEYLDERGRPTGYCVELTRAIAQQAGLNVKFRLGPWGDTFKALENGEIDLIHSLYYSPERDKTFDFSQPYAIIQHVAITREDTALPPSLEALKGQRILVLRGDIMHDLVKEQNLTPYLLTADTLPQVLRFLANGKADYALAARLPSLHHIDAMALEGLQVGSLPLLTPEYCYGAFPKHKRLLNLFSEGLTTLHKNQDYRRIHDRWLGVYAPPEVNLSDIIQTLAIITAPLLLVIGLGLLWVRTLRRRVARRTNSLQHALQQQEEAVRAGKVGLWEWDFSTNRVLYSSEWKRLIGYEDDEISDNYEEWRRRVHPDDLGQALDSIEEAIQSEGRDYRSEFRFLHKDGSYRWVLSQASIITDRSGNAVRMVGSHIDITERKQAEDEREFTIRILGLIGRPNSLRELMQSCTSIMREWSKCQAVGIRLAQGEDFPYYETRGFTEEFVQAETHLCAYMEGGEICRNDDGSPILEGMCGNILQGRTDPSLPFFTEHGSFWTNSTTDLLASTCEEDRQARTRNRCHGEGYESVALIPLRYGDRCLGLLQFNDERRDCFTPQRIRLYERLADNLAIGLAQRQEAAERNRQESRLRSLTSVMPAMLDAFDKDNNIIVWNRECERVTGYRAEEMIGNPDALSLLYPDDTYRAWVLDTIEKKGGDFRDLEFELTRKDGEKRVVSWSNLSNEEPIE